MKKLSTEAMEQINGGKGGTRTAQCDVCSKIFYATYTGEFDYLWAAQTSANNALKTHKKTKHPETVKLW